MKSLIFVYNADSGLASALFDSAHKLLSPGTYSCNLCALTHHLAGEKQDWKTFLQGAKTEMIFLHRDEWEKRYPKFKKEPLPLIATSENENDLPQISIPAEKMNAMTSLEELKAAVRELEPEPMVDSNNN